MLETIRNDGGDIQKWVDKARTRTILPPLRLRPPGVQELRPTCPHHQEGLRRGAEEDGVNDPVLDIAKAPGEIALKDDFFVERKLHPNVDFWQHHLPRHRHPPTRMFTVMFALGRLPAG